MAGAAPVIGKIDLTKSGRLPPSGFKIPFKDISMRVTSSIIFSLAFIAALACVALAVTHQNANQGLSLMILFGIVAILGAVLAFVLARPARRLSEITVGGVFTTAR